MEAPRRDLPVTDADDDSDDLPEGDPGIVQVADLRVSRDRLKSFVAILIGVVSVVGALVTWKTVQYSGQAGDLDGQSIDETVIQSADRARSEIELRSEEGAYVGYRGDRAAAASLRTLADQAAARGDAVRAARLRDEAQVLEETAANAANQFYDFDESGYVDTSKGESAPFDRERRQRDLILEYQRQRGEVDVFPERTADEADDARDTSQALAGWVVVLAFAVVLLTLAEQYTTRAMLLFTGAGVVVFVVACAGAVAAV